MKAHLLILQRVGTTLILLGGIGIYMQIWEFAYTTPSWAFAYFHELTPLLLIALAWWGIFFIAPGILLFRGGLKTAKYIRYLALFGIAGCAVSIVLAPFLQPLDFQLLLVRLTPGAVIFGIWQSIVYLVFGYWLQYWLGRSEIGDAQVDARITPASTFPSLWLGAACSLGLMGMLYLSLNGDDANKAVQMVRNKLGNNFQYFANNIHLDLADQIKVKVFVIGYNSHGFKQVTVRWKEADPDVIQ